MRRSLILPASLCLCLLAARGASADVTINFVELPNEAGIHFTGTDPSGNVVADVTKPGSEVFHLSSPIIPFGYPADATLGHIGISGQQTEYLVNILESPGGPISDQVHVYRLSGIFTVMDFISDPEQFVSGTADITIVETGALQEAITYANDRGESVHVNVLSDLEPVPEPSTALVASMGACGLVAYRIRRRRQQKAVV
jgi:hypothetical protein